MLRIIKKDEAVDPLAKYADLVSTGPVIVTDQGKPIAALVAIENADLETIALSTSPKFIALIERSRAKTRAEGAVSTEEMRRRFE